jgi:hypothetical protein
MKQKILIAICLLFTIVTKAQITTNLVVNTRPSARLNEWATNRGTLTLIVSTQTGGTQGRRVKIKTTLKAANGSEVSTTNMNLAQVVVLPDGNSVYDAGTIFPLEIQQFNGKYQSTLNKTGKLPADNYQICVTLVEETTFAPLSQERCGSFYLAASQLPICMMPANEQELDVNVARTAITFRWTPLVPKPQGASYYRLQVFEVIENQTPMQALRGNQPLLDEVIIERTQFIWQPQLAMQSKPLEPYDSSVIPKPKRFIWSIQTLDAKGDPVTVDANYEGRSEPMQFTISDKPKGRKKGYVGHVTLIK